MNFPRTCLFLFPIVKSGSKVASMEWTGEEVSHRSDCWISEVGFLTFVFFLFLRLGCPRWRNKSDGITSIHIQTTHSWERSSLYSYSSPLGYTITLPALGIWSFISCAKHISSCHLSVGLWPELKAAFPGGITTPSLLVDRFLSFYPPSRAEACSTTAGQDLLSWTNSSTSRGRNPIECYYFKKAIEAGIEASPYYTLNRKRRTHFLPAIALTQPKAERGSV